MSILEGIGVFLSVLYVIFGLITAFNFSKMYGETIILEPDPESTGKYQSGERIWFRTIDGVRSGRIYDMDDKTHAIDVFVQPTLEEEYPQVKSIAKINIVDPKECVIIERLKKI